MTDPQQPDPLGTLEAEWKLRQAVESAHATFHVRPSGEAAAALCEAVDAWWEVGVPPTSPERSGEVETPLPESDLRPHVAALERAIEVSLGMGAADQWFARDWKGASQTVANAILKFVEAARADVEKAAVLDYVTHVELPKVRLEFTNQPEFDALIRAKQAEAVEEYRASLPAAPPAAGLPRNVRAGRKVMVDGWPGTIGMKRGDKVFVSWFSGEPMRRADGSVLGWTTEQMHDEWIPLDSPRLAEREAAK